MSDLRHCQIWVPFNVEFWNTSNACLSKLCSEAETIRTMFFFDVNQNNSVSCVN